jgi:hypothetical protein
MNLFLLTASGIATIVCLLHIILGGHEAVRPLFQSKNLELVPRFTHYYCWHVVTLTIGTVAFVFGMGAVGYASVDLVALVVVLSGLFCIWSIVMIAWHRLNPFDFPQWGLFALLTIIGAFGLVS